MLVWMQVTLPLAAIVSKKVGKGKGEKDLFQMWLPTTPPAAWRSAPLFAATASVDSSCCLSSLLCELCAVFGWGFCYEFFCHSFTFYVLHSFSLKIFLCKKIPVFSRRENDLFIHILLVSMKKIAISKFWL